MSSYNKIACVMVGLPARGKTYIARKLVRYLDWLGYPTRIFNVGNYRRETVGAFQEHTFFDPNNTEFSNKRMELAMLALNDMLDWFDEQEVEAVKAFNCHSYSTHPPSANTTPDRANYVPNGHSPMDKSRFSTSCSPGGPSSANSTSSMASLDHVEFRAGGQAFIAVYDATNSTQSRRRLIYEKCKSKGVQVMFIESVCNDMDIILSNIREVKLSSPDYANVDSETAIQDFMNRIRHYETCYEPLTQAEKVPYVILMNVGQQVQINMIRGYLQSRIVYFLMNLNITKRHIYFARHGESEFNLVGKIGGDSDLSERGWTFAKKLPDLFNKIERSGGHEVASPQLKTKITVWTSSLKRTIQSSSFLNYPKMQWKQLDEIDSGVCDGLTYEEIEKMFPEDFRERDDDKYNYRYKGGESYRDLVQRLEPVIMELERHHESEHSIFIIGHQAILRAIYAYYMNYSQSELPYIKIPLHTVIKLTPKAYGCIEERFAIDVPAVDTYRPKPKESDSPPLSPSRNEIPEGVHGRA